jgi:hypothetical protein
MPNSMTTSQSPSAPPLYVPGSRGASVAAEWPAYIEKTMETIEDYARREPWTFAAWVFGVGFVLGWKLKPW